MHVQDFAIDLYPFYPPLVKVIRPRLQVISIYIWDFYNAELVDDRNI